MTATLTPTPTPTRTPANPAVPLARSVRAELRRVLHWPVTSRSTLADAQYRYDAIGRLLQRFHDPSVNAVSGSATAAGRPGPRGWWRHLRTVAGLRPDRRTVRLSTVPGAIGAFRRSAVTGG